jgi:phosphoribosylanthranilate isomerase
MNIKICGITNQDDALLCQDEGAHYLGFIFYEQSQRYISPSAAAALIKGLHPRIGKVGVFVNADTAFINQVVETAGLDYVQLHGDELPACIPEIQVKVIRAFRVSASFDFKQVHNYPGAIPLFDTYRPSAYGGTGEVFDWSRIPAHLAGTYFLSGGISPENILRVPREAKPFGVDLSSSVESAPGKKDPKKVRSLFASLRLIESATIK